MISKAVLDQAKAFLCWETFSDLTIQLVELKETVSYFYPPFKRSTIIVYYERGRPDFSAPLFLLFHEAGHRMQFEKMQKTNRESNFWNLLNTPTGSPKTAFEKEGWEKGKKLLEQFIHQNKLSDILIKNYDVYARMSIESYR